MDDVFDVVTMLHEVRGASITLDQRIVCGEAVLIEARVQVAFVSGGRARRIPEALRSAMQADQKPAS
jgi:acyl-CoA thioester hydrolase